MIDNTRQLFYWNSRGIKGDVLTWLQHFRGMSLKDAEKYLLTFDELDLYRAVVTPKDYVVYERLVKVSYNAGKRHRNYWYKRGISDATIARFQLGYMDEWYTIPIYVDDVLMNFQCRRDEPEKQIRSMYSGKGILPFNFDMLPYVDKVFITESPTDAILLSQYNVPAVSTTGGAGWWSIKYAKHFMKIKDIVIVYDNDEAGGMGVVNVAKILGINNCRLYTFAGFKPKYDLGDYIKENKGVIGLDDLINKESYNAIQSKYYTED